MDLKQKLEMGLGKFLGSTIIFTWYDIIFKDIIYNEICYIILMFDLSKQYKWCSNPT